VQSLQKKRPASGLAGAGLRPKKGRALDAGALSDLF